MKTALLAISLGAFLLVAIGFALELWLELNDVEVSTMGLIAMVLGIVFSLGLGMGLMWLVFKSSREGMDQ